MKFSDEKMSKLIESRNDLLDAWANNDFHLKGNKKIIAIDDCSHTLNYIFKILTKKSNFNVNVFDNELKALESILDDIPDLILLDINLKIVGGDKISQLIEKIIPFHVPIIFMTSDQSYISKYLKKNNKYSLLEKPLSQQTLTNEVNKYLIKSAA